MSAIAIITVVAVLLLLAGLALLVRGLRGYRVGDHPMCRACGFDLFGRPAYIARCSECGADVTRDRAIVIGQRVRRPGSAVLGAILLLIVSGAIFVAGNQSNLNPYKPLWWLKLEAQYASDPTADAALMEVTGRVRAGNLSDTSLTAWVDLAMSRQTGPAKRWRSGWADVIEAARTSGRLSHERWLQYARNALQQAVTLQIRQRVTRGDPVPWRVNLGGSGWRGSSANTGGLLRCTLAGLNLEGPLIHVIRNASFQTTFSGQGSAAVGMSMQPETAELDAMPDGPHEVKGVVQIDIADGVGRSLRLDMPLGATYTLLSKQESSVVPQSDPALADSIKASITVTQSKLLSPPNVASLYVDIDVRSAPISLAMEASARVHGTDNTVPMQRLTYLKSRAGASTHMMSLIGATPPEFLDALHAAGNRVDILLKPSREAAASTVDIVDYWTSENPIVIEDVNVASQREPGK